jgi:hypothetical protein
LDLVVVLDLVLDLGFGFGFGFGFDRGASQDIADTSGAFLSGDSTLTLGDTRGDTGVSLDQLSARQERFGDWQDLDGSEVDVEEPRVPVEFRLLF